MRQLEIRNLSKRFRKVFALRDLSFSLPPGKIYGFVGPNGSGKTTTLRIMAGLMLPDAGDVFYDNVSVVDYPDRIRRVVGFMPDTLPDSADIRVWEYLDFFARAFQLHGAEKEARLAAIAEMTNLENLPQKRLNELSKGMKQQVSLARLLLTDPEVLLLDEPAAGLDPRARLELRQTLLRMGETGKTIFISSHILSDLDDIIDGAVILEKGELVKVGSLEDLNGAIQEKNTAQVLLSLGCAADMALAKLQHLPGVQLALRHSSRQVMLTLDNASPAEFANAMGRIFATELPIIGMSRPDWGLEEIFMRSTRGEVQ